MISLLEFVRESNRIEGIHREPTAQEVLAHKHFLEIEGMVRPRHLREFVLEVAKAPMRLEPGMNVIVGGHRPMEGGPMVGWELDNLCDYAGTELPSPYELHVRYERLHPFMDGNGRSGRVWWLWYMERLGLNGLALPFLHRFYYQGLEASRLPTRRGEGLMGEQTLRGLASWLASMDTPGSETRTATLNQIVTEAKDALENEGRSLFTQHECELRHQVEGLEKDLAECYRLTGSDTDGDPDSMLAKHAVQAVRELREEADKAGEWEERAVSAERHVKELADQVRREMGEG